MKYVPGLMVGQLSGKAGSTVASHGKFGSYFRTRNVPTNPNTEAQQQKRNWLSAIAKSWKALSQLQRDSFDAIASTIAKTDKQGVTFFASGFDYYCELSMNISTYAGVLSYATNPPITPAPPALVSATLTADGGSPALSLAYTATPLGTNDKLVIEMTGPLSQGVKFIRRSEYRQIMVTAAAAASPTNLLTPWQARFGDLSMYTDRLIGLRAYVVDQEGQRSAYTSTTEVVI